MQKSLMWKLGALGFVTVASAAVVIGCGDDDKVAPVAPVEGQQCGPTVGSMNTQACTAEGYLCTVPINCGTGEHQVSRCTCSGGTFSCTGPDGQPVNGSDEPTCVDIPETTPPTCEASADEQNDTPCDTLRRTCRYASVSCPGDATGKFDTCDCRQVGGDNALKWVCSKNTCGEGGIFVPPDSGSSSGGSSSGGTDAGSDAGDDDDL